MYNYTNQLNKLERLLDEAYSMLTELRSSYDEETGQFAKPVPVGRKSIDDFKGKGHLSPEGVYTPDPAQPISSTNPPASNPSGQPSDNVDVFTNSPTKPVETAATGNSNKGGSQEVAGRSQATSEQGNKSNNGQNVGQ